MPHKNATPRYEITIKGQLSGDWSDWFSGLTLSHDDNGNTVLSGEVVDQSALHGLLKRIRDAGAELISVNPISQAGDQMTTSTHESEIGDKQ